LNSSVAGAQGDEDAHGVEAAIAAAQPVTGPEPAEGVLDADLEQLVDEAAVAEGEVIVKDPARVERTSQPFSRASVSIPAWHG
jgi:hypothetical protein